MTGQRFWPLIVGLTLLLAGAAALWWAGSREPTIVPRAGEAVTPTEPGDPVEEYVAFGDHLRTDPELTDAAIVDGLRKLARALAGAETPADVAIDLRIVAEHIVLNPDAVETTEVVRRSLLAAADALDERNGDAQLVRPLAASIDVRIPLTHQRDRLSQFFVGSADRLRQS